MSVSAERYYEFLSRDEALDAGPIDRLPIADQHKAVLKEAHIRIARLLRVITLEHLDYTGRLVEAQMVVHEEMADTIQQRFAFLRDSGFAIEKMIPIVVFGHKDSISMAKNNTSGQRTDFIGNPARGLLSKHFLGVAVDIEPVHNKQRERNGLVVPPHTPDYTERQESMLMYNLPVRMDFSDAGFEYGGTWPVAGIGAITGHPDFYPGAPADEHHFELRDAKLPTETNLVDMRDITLPEGIIYEHPGRIRAAFAA